jgi:hypothetical protein
MSAESVHWIALDPAIDMDLHSRFARRAAPREVLMRLVVVGLFGLMTAGCCKGGGKSDDTPIPSPNQTPVTPVNTVADTTKPTLTLTAPATPATAPTAATAGGYLPDGLPADIPASRSAVPTLAEWSAVPREINCPRSTPLNCETKMLREWLRVSCHPKSSTGGTPTTVDHKSGPKDDAYYFAKGGVTSLVTPVLRGKHMEATFNWTDKRQTLVIDWPHGAPRPAVRFQD